LFALGIILELQGETIVLVSGISYYDNEMIIKRDDYKFTTVQEIISKKIQQS